MFSSTPDFRRPETTLHYQEPDRVPRANLQTAEMAQLAAAGHTIMLGYDTVMPIFSVVQEASALGREITMGEATQIIAACQRVIAASVQILAPECAVPLTTPTENLTGLVAAAKAKARAGL